MWWQQTTFRPLALCARSKIMIRIRSKLIEFVILLAFYVFLFIILRTISKNATVRDDVTASDVTIYSYILHRRRQTHHRPEELPEAQNQMLYSMEQVLYYMYYPCIRIDLKIFKRMHYFDYDYLSRKYPDRYK